MEILGLVDIPLWLLLLIFLLVTIYFYGTWTFGAFKDSVLKGPKPVPILGNNLPAFTKGIIGFYLDLIQRYGGHYKSVAFFDGLTPTVLTIDPDVIKAVTIKEFHNFSNRMSFTTGTEPSCLMLTVTEGETWKRLRSLMSPTFSSGKLKLMAKPLHDCCLQVVQQMKKHAENGTPLMVKDCAGAFTLDAIAITSFGLKLNSFDNPEDPFVQKAKKVFDVSIFNPVILAFFFRFLRPVCRLFDLDIVQRDVTDFFGNITEQLLEERRKGNVVQTDFLQLMLNAHEDDQESNDNADETEKRIIGSKPKQGMSHKELVAQAILFFVAGYDTTASSLSYLLYNLTAHPEIQEKLRQEVIKCTAGKSNTDILDYNTLGEMTFMDQCIKESQRMFPPLIRVDRVAENDININGIDFKKDWTVSIPVYALQHNPDVWPEPDVFKPERFANLNPVQTGSFLPFGNGPRNCIGMRLALLEIKMVTAHILRNFNLVRCDETQVPLKLNKKSVFMQPEKPIKVGVQLRA